MAQSFFAKARYWKGCPEKCPPWKKTPAKSLQENCPPENYPRKYVPREIAHRINVPQEKNFTRFLLLLRLFLLKLFKLTSFRNVSRTPATSIVHLLVTVVNSIDYCHKKLLFRSCQDRRFASEFIRLSFSEIFISKAHSSASDLPSYRK